jgi:preprotein translocase subunit YajC
MQLDWLLHPATFYSAALVCLATSLWLVVSVKIEMARTRSFVELQETIRSGDDVVVRGLKAEIEKLREAVSRLEETRPARVPTAAGMNLTKRAQALRMHRRGEALTSIAAALETPSNEIALMLKVHELTTEDERAS